MWRSLIEVLELRSEAPNKFTRYLGEQVKKARKEKKVSQETLAEAVYKRRASISEIESGKMMPDIATMVYMSHYFEKPIDYFLHPKLRYNPPSKNNLTLSEYELLNEFQRLSGEKQQLAIEQIRTLADHFERE
jgi:transcriptional regulator with XRE-family HTH domain